MDKPLIWDVLGCNIKENLDVSGDHFSMMELENFSSASEIIKKYL